GSPFLLRVKSYLGMIRRIRLFIAIEIPDPIKAELTKLQNLLRRAQADISWTKPENIHLTLHFLGEVEEGRLEILKQRCAVSAAEFAPFMMTLDGAGVFPDFRRPRVLWAGLSGELEIATQLQKQI